MALLLRRPVISSRNSTMSSTGPKMLIRAGLLVQIASPDPFTLPASRLAVLTARRTRRVKTSGTLSRGRGAAAPAEKAEGHGSLSPGTKMRVVLERVEGNSERTEASALKCSLYSMLPAPDSAPASTAFETKLPMKANERGLSSTESAAA